MASEPSGWDEWLNEPDENINASDIVKSLPVAPAEEPEEYKEPAPADADPPDDPSSLRRLPKRKARTSKLEQMADLYEMGTKQSNVAKKAKTEAEAAPPTSESEIKGTGNTIYNRVISPPQSQKKLDLTKTARPTAKSPRHSRPGSKKQIAWNTHYQSLIKYKAQHGHCNVPNYSKEYPVLSRWVKRQRYIRKENRITQDRIDALDAIGFSWNLQQETWHHKFEQLKEYYATYGRNHPTQPPSNSLNVWIKMQRRQYKKFKLFDNSQLSSERIRLLESIGFQWQMRPYRTQLPAKSER